MARAPTAIWFYLFLSSFLFATFFHPFALSYGFPRLILVFFIVIISSVLGYDNSAWAKHWPVMILRRE
jgi:hypothetical protein